ncbi:hypothetical protein IAU59_005622 [Kwoniella sp. CBS 9459]
MDHRTDTQQELESCGGCFHGEANTFGIALNRVNWEKGIDCTTLSGVIPRGVTCQDGQCVNWSGEEGFTLEMTAAGMPEVLSAQNSWVVDTL